MKIQFIVGYDTAKKQNYISVERPTRPFAKSGWSFEIPMIHARAHHIAPVLNKICKKIGLQ